MNTAVLHVTSDDWVRVKVSGDLKSLSTVWAYIPRLLIAHVHTLFYSGCE